MNPTLTPADDAPDDHITCLTRLMPDESRAPHDAGPPPDPVASGTRPGPGSDAALQRVRVKANGRVVVLGTDEIDWIDGLGNYARLHSGPVVYRLRERLKNLERRLDPARFLRIHRSRIVNVGRIHELVRGAHRACSVVLVDGTPLRVSRAYRARVRQVAAGTGERT